MEVEIDDALLEDLLADDERRGRKREPHQLVEDLIRVELRKSADGDYGICGLTGCRTLWAFKRDLNRDTWGESWTDHSLYEERFLCVDIDNFKHFIDYEGMGRSDEILASIGSQLRAHFGEEDTYRYGGDEFVVRLRGREVWLPDVPEAIALKWAVVAVRIHRNQRRNHHLNGWIEHHLSGAILSGTLEGGEIHVETPKWMPRE